MPDIGKVTAKAGDQAFDPLFREEDGPGNLISSCLFRNVSPAEMLF